MGVMAVAALNSPPKHFTLQKRGINIILIIHLPVCMKKFCVRYLWNIIIHDLTTLNQRCTDVCFPGMIHPFFTLGGVVDDAAKAEALIAAALRKL